ncbi:flavodoxin domain-containing protein [Lentilactobacillus farraginis]|nr:flavodoxin domain-containing protein [Lentilactobacillus farraginis]GAF35499.1 flavodoxin [Lentilactobacillus farraginis DSM 18382 = JCM 14108]
MLSATVIYASLTGNNAEIATFITNYLIKQAVQTKMIDMLQADLDEITDRNILVVVPYTYGSGDLPPEGLAVYDDVHQTDLNQLTYGVVGSGDRLYGADFCRAVTIFDAALAHAGANRGADPLFVDLQPDIKDQAAISTFVDQIIQQTTMRAKQS